MLGFHPIAGRPIAAGKRDPVALEETESRGGSGLTFAGGFVISGRDLEEAERALGQAETEYLAKSTPAPAPAPYYVASEPEPAVRTAAMLAHAEASRAAVERAAENEARLAVARAQASARRINDLILLVALADDD